MLFLTSSKRNYVVGPLPRSFERFLFVTKHYSTGVDPRENK